MPWNGYRDDEADIGQSWGEIENCSLYTKGLCVRRLGFGAKVDLSGAVVRSASELGNYALCATAAGAILSITQSSSAVASITTGLSTTNWPTWASMNGRIYFSNGVDTVRVSDDGTGQRVAGITSPSVAATATPTGSGGVVTAGVHLFRYRYYDSVRNRLSNASVAASGTVTAGQTVTVGYTVSGDATVDKIIIEVTGAGASAYYRAATLSNAGSSTSFNTADASLIVGVSASRDGEASHDVPPTGYDIITEHRQRLWMWKTSTGDLIWSRAMFPESWDAVNYGRRVTMNDGDTPSAVASFYSDLYLVGQRSMRRMVYTSDPAAAMIVDLPGSFGAFNQRCVLKVDGGLLVGWGRNGAWMIDAMQPKKISRHVDDTLVALVAASATTERFMAYEPLRREVAFFFPLSGQTTCKAALIWSMDTNEWTLWKFRQPITAGCMNAKYSDRARLMICDANGFAWRMGAASNDGGGAGEVTVTTGSTTTVINAVNTATTGQTLYHPTTGEERRITAASGTSVTVTPALAAAPTAGIILYIGSIRQRMVTDHNPGGGMNAKKRPTKLLMAIRPDTSMGDAQVNFYTDFATTKEAVSSFAADTFGSGVSIASNQISIDLDTGGTDGFIPIPCPGDWKRVIQAEIIAETPLDGVRFMDIEFRDDSTEPSEEE